jgi:hypothetical protein
VSSELLPRTAPLRSRCQYDSLSFHCPLQRLHLEAANNVLAKVLAGALVGMDGGLVGVDVEARLGLVGDVHEAQQRPACRWRAHSDGRRRGRRSFPRRFAWLGGQILAYLEVHAIDLGKEEGLFGQFPAVSSLFSKRRPGAMSKPSANCARRSSPWSGATWTKRCGTRRGRCTPVREKRAVHRGLCGEHTVASNVPSEEFRGRWWAYDRWGFSS